MGIYAWLPNGEMKSPEFRTCCCSCQAIGTTASRNLHAGDLCNTRPPTSDELQWFAEIANGVLHPFDSVAIIKILHQNTSNRLYSRRRVPALSVSLLGNAPLNRVWFGKPRILTVYQETRLTRRAVATPETAASSTASASVNTRHAVAQSVDACIVVVKA